MLLQYQKRELLQQMFFLSSSPLRTEADNWFLRELRGRYDTVLRYVATHPGCSNADLTDHLNQLGESQASQAGGYIKILRERYGMIERLLPVFASAKARSGRFYIRDNFLRAWLAALATPTASINFRPLPDLVDEADRRLREVEGQGFERLVRALYEERRALVGALILMVGTAVFSGTIMHVIEGHAQPEKFGTNEVKMKRMPSTDRRLRIAIVSVLISNCSS
jgi:hypothetical protein